MRTLCVMLMLAALSSARPARACGSWQAHDRELKRWIGFHHTSTQLSSANRKRGPFKLIQRLGTRGDDVYSLIGQHKDFHFKGNKLYRRGKVVARIEGDTVKFRYLRFRIDIDPGEGKRQGTWRVKIRLGQKLLVVGNATPTCGGGEAPAAAKQEIRRRLVLYLAWRRLVRKH